MVQNTAECIESQCSTCKQDCNARTVTAIPRLKEGSSVKKVVGVVSGKGGVGKSLITTLLALEMRRRGHKVGILDADLTGPSVPQGLGLAGQRAGFSEKGIEPAVSPDGVKAISINLLMEDENQPVIWRGPVISGVVKQFWTDVNWGELAFMFVDMPPGTADVTLTVFQSLPVDGVIIVSSPQNLVAMIVSKAVNMANELNVPVLGLVENMAYVQCPDCGKRIYHFGKSHVAETAAKFGLPLLGSLPVDSRLAEAYDRGSTGDGLYLLPTELGDAVEKLLNV